jgi:hypothetical protein
MLLQLEVDSVLFLGVPVNSCGPSTMSSYAPDTRECDVICYVSQQIEIEITRIVINLLTQKSSLSVVCGAEV